MNDVQRRLNKIIVKSGQSYNSFGKKIGLSRSQALYDIRDEKIKSISADLANSIVSTYPMLNLEWVLNGSGNMYKDTNGYFTAEPPLMEADRIKQYEDEHARKPKLEAKPLRLADPNGFEATNERFYTLPDDSLIMQTPVIPYRAWGSYLRGHADPEFYADLETIPLPVDKKHFGSYLIFEMGGDSMVNYSTSEMARKSLWPGQKIVGRDLSRDKWKYKLHINSTDAWIIVHKTEGIVVKSIIDHDVDSALITLHSWNPDKETYPDFTVSLNDVEQIFNVVDPFNKLNN